MTYTFGLSKSELTPLEDKFLRQRLDSFAGFVGYTLSSAHIDIETNRELEGWELAIVPSLIAMWLPEKVELNIDIDLRNQIPDFITMSEVTDAARLRLVERFAHGFVRNGFKRNTLEYRLSSGGNGVHIRVKDLLFEPKYVLNMRIPLRDCMYRLQHDRGKFAAGLDCVFLYDMKRNIKAGNWTQFKEE